MYEWIFKADVVVADISTLNANALYELGIRHALRPHTTIVISEKNLQYPFDVNHVMIDKYEHLGTDIGVTEATRFKKHLSDKVTAILKTKKIDSPIYTFLPTLNPPSFSNKEIEKLKKESQDRPSLSELMTGGEEFKDKDDFKTAKQMFLAALEYDQNNVFLIQRIALVTYKAGLPNKKKALIDAEKILLPLKPLSTTDTETLGLSGAINKRLYELTNEIKYLKKSILFYEKGFYINNDYYNGVNVAFMYLTLASQQTNRNKIIANYELSKNIYLKIVENCNDLIKRKDFKERNDVVWIYQSLTQAYLALNDKINYNKTLSRAKKASKGEFDFNTFEKHNEKVINLLTSIRRKLKNR